MHLSISQKSIFAESISFFNFHLIFLPILRALVLFAIETIVLKYTKVMPCDLDQSWANIYGSSVGWLENTRMSTQPICYSIPGIIKQFNSPLQFFIFFDIPKLKYPYLLTLVQTKRNIVMQEKVGFIGCSLHIASFSLVLFSKWPTGQRKSLVLSTSLSRGYVYQNQI